MTHWISVLDELPKPGETDKGQLVLVAFGPSTSPFVKPAWHDSESGEWVDLNNFVTYPVAWTHTPLRAPLPSVPADFYQRWKADWARRHKEKQPSG